jgi:hypothetical protein
MADALISAFNVDALYNIPGTPSVEAFIKTFPNLQWPGFHTELFVQDANSKKRPTLLDVVHPAQHLFKAHIDGREKPAIRAALYQWGADDPFRYVLTATLGAYPAESVTGRDYSQFFQKALAAPLRTLSPTEAIPDDLYSRLTPNSLTAVELEPVFPHFSARTDPGFYYGNPQDFTDLVNFWNLRACDLDVFFYDPNQTTRLESFTRAYAELLRARPNRAGSQEDITLWSKQPDLTVDTSPFGAGLSLSGITVNGGGQSMEWSQPEPTDDGIPGQVGAWYRSPRRKWHIGNLPAS